MRDALVSGVIVGLFVEGLRKAGLRVCATGAELAPYPNAVRLPECVTS